MDKIIAFAPATVANVGPNYDIMGYALDYLGDFVTLEKVDVHPQNGEVADVVWGGVDGPGAESLCGEDWQRNTAWLVADHLWKRHLRTEQPTFQIRLTLHKYMPVGSGLGSSAASAAAAAKAVSAMLGLKLDHSELISTLELGEEVSSGAGYPDNVVPSYFGGFHLIQEEGHRANTLASARKRTNKLHGGETMISVVVRPEITVTTRQGRQQVRDFIQSTYLKASNAQAAGILELVREQSAKAAEMVRAFMTNDVPRVGQVLGDNPLLEGARAALIPNFCRVKQAALNAGAFGCTIAGSGPAMVAIVNEMGVAEEVRTAMIRELADYRPKWIISPINDRGSEIVPCIGRTLEVARPNHNFF